MDIEDRATQQGLEADKELKKSRNLKSLLKYFQQSGEFKPRRIRKVRELYRYGKVSQMVFDVSMRVLLNFGSWTTSFGLGLHRGYAAFQASRIKFHAESRLRPPIHISVVKARQDLERLLVEGKVVWED